MQVSVAACPSTDSPRPWLSGTRKLTTAEIFSRETLTLFPLLPLFFSSLSISQSIISVLRGRQTDIDLLVLAHSVTCASLPLPRAALKA